MDFLQTDAQEAIRKGFKNWLAEHLPKQWRNIGKSTLPPHGGEAHIHRSWEKIMSDHGWAAVHWPIEYGGRGWSMREHLVIQEELGLSGAPEGLNSMGRELVGPILLKVGTSEQKARFLKNIVQGSEIWCQGFSEPNAGSDLGSLKTVATLTENGWSITGQKIWTSYAADADFCLLLARAKAEAESAGPIAMYIMPMRVEGVTVRPIEQINGKREFCEVFLEDVRLPANSLVGTLKEGWRTARQVLSVERGTNKLYRQASFRMELQTVSRLIGNVRETALKLNLQRRAAMLNAKLNVLRYRNFGLVNRLENGEDLGNGTSTHKLYWSELHQEICELGLDVLASLPDVTDNHARRLLYAYLSSRAETIFAGTSQIQRDIIARHVLRLPELS